jgi:hypothetical protein
VATEDSRKRGRKKKKKSENRWKYRFLKEILKNGVVGGSKNGDFIGLNCFWAKNEGKNLHFFVKNERVLSVFCHEDTKKNS